MADVLLQIRHDPSLIDDWRYPVIEAGGYVGRQMWSSVISCLFVYLPVTALVGMVLWEPTRDKMIIYLVIPVGSFVALETVSFSLRRALNRRAACKTHSGTFIQNRCLPAPHACAASFPT